MLYFQKTKNQTPESVVTNDGGSMTGPANTAEESTPAAQLAHLDIISANRTTFMELATSPVALDPFPLTVRPNATKNELHAGLCETRDRWQRAEGLKQGVLIGVDQGLVHAKTCQQQLLAHAEAQTGRLLARFDACMEAERKDRERRDREAREDRERRDREAREERAKLYNLLVGRLEKGKRKCIWDVSAPEMQQSCINSFGLWASQPNRDSRICRVCAGGS